MELLSIGRYLKEHDDYKHKGLPSSWPILIKDALNLIKSGVDLEIFKAEKKLLNALSLASKNGLAKASVCHELGVLYFTHHTVFNGGTYKSLSQSIKYFERALSSTRRKEFPDKYASSLSQLAAAYRRASHEYLWPERDCLQKAKQLHFEAIDIVNKSNNVPTSLKIRELSVIYFNLSTVMFDLGLTVEACECQAKFIEYYLQFYKYYLPNYFTPVPPNQALAVSYARLNNFSNKQEHKQLCKVILDIAPEFGVEPSICRNMSPQIDITKPEEKITYLVHKAIQYPTDENVKKLEIKQHQLMMNRRHCQSDAESDHMAYLAQRICSGLARILSNDDAQYALRILENCSALRFCESASRHWHQSENKKAMNLYRDLGQLGATYHNLNELALMVEHLREIDVQQVISACYDRACQSSSSQEIRESVNFFNVNKLPDVLRIATKHKDPANYLRSIADDCLLDFKKIEHLIENIDSDFVKQCNSIESIKISHFEKALRINPELTLIRIDIETDFYDALILVAQLVNEQLVVKGYTVPLPKKLVDTISMFVRGESKLAGDWQLDFLDWNEILPENCKKIGLLTSYFASHIPWIATGVKNKELHTLIEDVCWIPTVLYLCNQIVHFNKRSGSKCINGGETRFHSVANQNTSGVLVDVSKSGFIDMIRKNDVFSYYGHCAHEYPERPYLKTKHFNIQDIELVNQVAGIERVEFWACQSGSNIPLSVFSIPVNEAFGFDMRMIEWGAVSSIGSLWALPDIVTAHIKSYYDQLVNKGTSPSKALLASQHWWVTQGANAELDKMRELGIPLYLNSLGSNESLDCLLGPMKINESQSDDKLKQAERFFLHPSSWAGLRFCGIAEQINQTVYKDRVDLTVEETNQLKEHLTKQRLKSGFIKYV